MFPLYHPSSMGTSKWYMLDHVLKNLKRRDDICYMDNGVYEMFRKNSNQKIQRNKDERREEKVVFENIILEQHGDKIHKSSSNLEREEFGL